MMPLSIDLILFNSQKPVLWAVGQAHTCAFTPLDLFQKIEEIKKSSAFAVLFWDASFGDPPENILDLLDSSMDVWHGGLKLGMQGLPGMIDFVNPTWMYNRDSSPDTETVSWRLSFRACLIKTEVFRQLGNIDSAYESLEASGLDFGHRCLQRGVFMRYNPKFLIKDVQEPVKVSISDELRFIGAQYDKKWILWSIFRAVFNGYSLKALLKAKKALKKQVPPKLPEPFKRKDINANFDLKNFHNKVTVLIPTLERYSYLETELLQLRAQTVHPKEIMVVDQTPLPERDENILKKYTDLPIKAIYQNVLGQCTAWNAALKASTGEYLLFLGDDADHITPDFLEKFLKTFQEFPDVDMVASAVEEKGAGPLPFSLTFMRISDTFPICMIRRSALVKSGLFDYAFDRGSRADADLAMRCYLSGAFMVFNPEITIFHHRAPRGGLRKHKARVITFSSSRKNIFQRNIQSITEIYLNKKYFTAKQSNESAWHYLAGTFSSGGDRVKKILKFFASFCFLPHTLLTMKMRKSDAVKMFEKYPRVENLESK